MELTFDRVLGILGIVFAIVLVVLDKAGKLRGPVLLLLLSVAALMTLPLALGNSWVRGTPWGMLKFSKGMLMISAVAICYSVLAVWISPYAGEDKSPELTEKREPMTPAHQPSSPPGEVKKEPPTKEKLTSPKPKLDKRPEQPNTTDKVTPASVPPLATSAFDQKPAEWRFENMPNDLTLHDLFLLDFKAVQQKAYGAVFVDENKTVSVEYAINVELSLRSKFLSFYIGRQDQQTAAICEYLSKRYQWLLDNAPQLLIEQKNPGDSGTTSTKEAMFSNRIYVYHETYLPAEETVRLTQTYKQHGVSAIFRGIDYLSNKKLEANVLKLRKEQGIH